MKRTRCTIVAFKSLAAGANRRVAASYVVPCHGALIVELATWCCWIFDRLSLHIKKKKKAVIYKTVLVQDWWDRSTHPQVQAARRRHVRSLGKRQRDRVWLLRAAKLAAVRHYVDAYVSFENFPANTSTSECLDRRAWEGARVYRESVHVWCPTVRQILKKQHLCRQCILPCEINTIPRLP